MSTLDIVRAWKDEEYLRELERHPTRIVAAESCGRNRTYRRTTIRSRRGS